jgi:hypothetical protein
MYLPRSKVEIVLGRRLNRLDPSFIPGVSRTWGCASGNCRRLDIGFKRESLGHESILMRFLGGVLASGSVFRRLPSTSA